MGFPLLIVQTPFACGPHLSRDSSLFTTTNSGLIFLFLLAFCLLLSDPLSPVFVCYPLSFFSLEQINLRWAENLVWGCFMLLLVPRSGMGNSGLRASKSLWRASGFHARHFSFQQIPETSEFDFPVSVFFFVLLNISFHLPNVWLSRLLPRMPDALGSGT